MKCGFKCEENALSFIHQTLNITRDDITFRSQRDARAPRPSQEGNFRVTLVPEKNREVIRVLIVFSIFNLRTRQFNSFHRMPKTICQRTTVLL